MKCEICGSDKLVIRGERVLFSQRRSEFTCKVCSDCNHVEVLPPLSSSEGGQDYIRKNTAYGGAIPPTILARCENVLSFLPEAEGGKVYDIGAGNCLYCEAFKQLGLKAYAVDVERFNEQYEDFVFADDLPAFLEENGASAFFSNHCFEHIETEGLTSLLTSIKPYIRIGAIGYFTVPTPKAELVQHDIYLEEFVYGHKNLFSANSAKLFFENIFPASEGFVVLLQSPKAKTNFLKTRLLIAFHYLKRGKLFKFIRLINYLSKTVIWGSKEELTIIVSRKDT